jgi:hypothetical protein
MIENFTCQRQALVLGLREAEMPEKDRDFKSRWM